MTTNLQSCSYTSTPRDNMVRIKLEETFLTSPLIGDGSCRPSGNSPLPIINLGYVKQQATSYNSTYDFYHFSNTRYAAPPLIDLKFRKPQGPLPQDGIQNGDIPFLKSACVQTSPPAFGLPGTPPGSDLGVEDCLVSLLTLIQWLFFFSLAF